MRCRYYHNIIVLYYVTRQTVCTVLRDTLQSEISYTQELENLFLQKRNGRFTHELLYASAATSASPTIFQKPTPVTLDDRSCQAASAQTIRIVMLPLLYRPETCSRVIAVQRHVERSCYCRARKWRSELWV